MAKQGKSKIIDTAFYLFLKQGYQGTSIQDIMTMTGLSKGAVYYHFQSKKDIYLAVVEQFYFRQMELVGEADTHLPFKERIRNRFEIFCQISELVERSHPSGLKFPLRSYFIFQLESERDDAIRELVVQALEAYRSDVLGLVNLAKEKGEIDVNLESEVIAHQLISLIEGSAIHHSTEMEDVGATLLAHYDKVVGGYLDLISTKSVPSQIVIR